MGVRGRSRIFRWLHGVGVYGSGSERGDRVGVGFGTFVSAYLFRWATGFRNVLLTGVRACSILWTAVFGIFGKLYIHANAQGDKGIERMKSAVWVDLVNMLLWLVTAVMAVVVFFMGRGGRTLFTGRGKV